MKRIITFIALLTCFLGAKAEWVTDYEIDYSRYSGFPFYVMGYVPEWNEGVMTDYGSTYRYETQDNLDGDDDRKLKDGEFIVGSVTTNNGTEYQKVTGANPYWHTYFLADGIPTELFGDYTIKAMVRASETCTINVNMGWGWGSGQQASASVEIPASDDFTEVEWTCTGIGGTSCNLVAQPGTVTATIEWQWVTVSHEKNEQIEWEELLVNGDAETPWGNLANVQYNDWDNNYKVCAWAKEKGVNLDDTGGWVPFPATIEEEVGAESKNHVFVVHANKIDEDGNAWDNEFWMMSPKSWKAGEQIMVHFRYKASQTVRTGTQFHSNPTGYLHWSALGNIEFTTDWQEFEKVVTIPDAADGAWSIEFQLNYEVRDAVDFYFDDLSWQAMKLDEGYFVAGANTLEGIEYDYDNAIEFVYDEQEECYIATVGSKDAYVNQIMISTARGNDVAFKSRTLKPVGSIKGDPDEWLEYTESSFAKLNLPGVGIWKVWIDPNYMSMAFDMLEGTPTPPDEINPNPTVVVVQTQERDFLSSEQEDGMGNVWDNQFWIVANRPLSAGETTIVEFDYVASRNAVTSTQSHAGPGEYLHYFAIGSVEFTTEEQHMSMEFTVPKQADGMQSIAFNMSEIKEACNYTIKNVIWKLADDTESLINQTGVENFYLKEGVSETYVYNPDLVEEARLVVARPTIKLGRESILPIYMVSSRKDLVAFQFDIWLPEGFDFNSITLNESNSDTHTISCNLQDDGSWRIVVASLENDVLTDVDNGLLNLGVYVNDYLGVGEYYLDIKNVSITTADYKTLKPADKPFIVNVKDPVMLGDVNSDAIIDVTDVVLIIDNILGKNPKNFDENAADVNFDDEINVTDVVVVIDAILGKTTLSRANVADAERIGSVEMPAQLNLVSGQAVNVPVSLSNPTAYTAFQMDVMLPMGVSMEKVQLTARGTDSHRVSVFQTGEGRYRIVGVSMENEALNGNSGELLNMTLMCNGQVSGIVAVNNILFVTPNGIQHELTSIESAGNITGIADVKMSASECDIYDLQGRKVNGNSAKNVYIVNGKKAVVK